MPRGHNVSTYHFQVYDKEADKNYYFFEYNNLKEKFNIPKSSVYKMIKLGPDHNMKKWNKYTIYSIKKPLYERTQIFYE